MVEEQVVEELTEALHQAQKHQEEQVSKKYETEIAAAEAEHQKSLHQMDETLTEQIETLIANHDAELNDNVSDFKQLLEELQGAVYDWNDEFWHTYTPRQEGDPPACHRIGTLRINGHFNQLETLALLPIINGQNVIFKASGAAKDQALQAFQSLILRLVAASPIGKILLVAIDPQGQGDNIVGLVDTKQKEATEMTAYIEANLDNLLQHLSSVEETYLSYACPTLTDIRSQRGIYPIPHRILAIANFPHGFSTTAIQKLAVIMKQGAKCGVHTVMMADTDLATEADLEKLDNSASVISYQQDRFVYQNMKYSEESPQDLDLELDRLPEASLVQTIINAVGKSAMNHQADLIPLSDTSANSAEDE